MTSAQAQFVYPTNRISGRDRPKMTQFVAPQGSLTPDGDAHGLNIELAQELYRDMMLARRLDSEALALQRQGELNLWLMSWGQEAAQVGSIRALRQSDMVFPSYREHAAAFCRGIPAAELLLQWRGSAHAGWDSARYRFHIYSLVLATQTLHAAGYAMGAAMEGTDEVVMVYFGDGAASQGDANEALNWAAAGRLPVLFFCQNNQWAISTPTATQMASSLHQRAEGFGIKSFHVDGNDVLAVHAVTTEAAAYIRESGAPALVEAQTYRRGGHSSSDDPKRYRSADELKLWESRDPISRLQILLEGEGIDAGFFAAVDESCEKLAVSVRSACRSLSDPELGELFGNVYAEPHTLIETEHRHYLDLAAKLEGGE